MPFFKFVNSYQRYQDYNLVRQTRVSSTSDSSVTLITKYLLSQTSTKLKSTGDPKFKKVVPNTAKVIYSWDKKILFFSKNLKVCQQEIYSNDHIIYIRVNIGTELMTIGLMIPSGTKRPPAVTSTQWCK